MPREIGLLRLTHYRLTDYNYVSYMKQDLKRASGANGANSLLIENLFMVLLLKELLMGISFKARYFPKMQL